MKLYHIVKRRLSLLEYEAYKVFEDNGLRVPKFAAVKCPEEVEEKIKSFRDDVTVKAQVPAGGRGKGSFSSGLASGIVKTSKNEARSIVSKMLGHRLKTAQTSKEGILCRRAMIAETIVHDREFYISITLVPGNNRPLLLFSSKGGVNIESVDAADLVKCSISIENSDRNIQEASHSISKKLDAPFEAVYEYVNKLFKVFVGNDATLVEVNPGTINDGHLLCLDAKVNLDENALYKRPDMENSEGREAKHGIESLGMSFVQLDGDIACLVNGAGLSMATMDLIKSKGGRPANFLDIGGAAKEDQIVTALNILNEQEDVKVIFVNVFGGIIKCDDIARAILKVNTIKPLILRLQGTNSDLAHKLIDESKKKNIMFEVDMDIAADIAVQQAK